MLRGSFGGSEARLWLSGDIFLVRSGEARSLNFLVDTGASRTILPEEIARDLGFDPSATGIARVDSTGFGGAFKMYSERAVLQFTSADSLYFHAIEVGVMAGGADSSTIPPILGLDILNQWRVSFSRLDDLLRCDVLSCTHEVARGPRERVPRFEEVVRMAWPA
ncbi:MAG: retroviral-like aspartic protease family protein [Armatimonadetes bacterium]|nr:retroviral-like aspartic protease family protein [Armatimonadota bacterium]